MHKGRALDRINGVGRLVSKILCLISSSLG